MEGFETDGKPFRGTPRQFPPRQPIFERRLVFPINRVWIIKPPSFDVFDGRSIQHRMTGNYFVGSSPCAGRVKFNFTIPSTRPWQANGGYFGMLADIRTGSL